jgi:hypothetical protein
MRENRTYGSEGGEALSLPDPYRVTRGADFTRSRVGTALARLCPPYAAEEDEC